jgi:formylglycine-generating enzyme required for sulfatase activity
MRSLVTKSIRNLIAQDDPALDGELTDVDIDLSDLGYQPTFKMLNLGTFEVANTTVTEADWIASGARNPSRVFDNRPAGEDAGQCPVQNVNRYEAMWYCNWLSRQKGLPEYYDLRGCVGTPGVFGPGLPSYRMPGNRAVPVNPDGARGYRLETEDEYDFRSKNPGGTYVPAGQRVDDVAWYSANSGNRTRPVRGKAANGHGVYDAIGNVYQWLDTTTPGGDGVNRGGGWCSNAARVGAANRDADAPSSRFGALGFRVARSL